MKGKPRKDLGSICQSILSKNEKELKNRNFFSEGRIKMLEELLKNLDCHVSFPKKVLVLMNFCIKTINVYRSCPEAKNFRTCDPGSKRIPRKIAKMIKGDFRKSPFNWPELEMVGRNLFALSVPDSKTSSRAQSFLLLADLFFLFEGPGAFERGIKENPLALSEDSAVSQGIKLLKILKKYLEKEYFLNLICKFEDSLDFLESQNPQLREKTQKILKQMWKESK